jgi:hypothetical protein
MPASHLATDIRMERLKLAGLGSLVLTLLGGLAMILGMILVDVHSRN